MGVEKLCLSITETAYALGVSKPTVYNLLKTDGFPAIRIGGRTMIPVDGLRQWVEIQAKKRQEENV